jgi:hypothetical protein
MWMCWSRSIFGERSNDAVSGECDSKDRLGLENVSSSSIPRCRHCIYITGLQKITITYCNILTRFLTRFTYTPTPQFLVHFECRRFVLPALLLLTVQTDSLDTTRPYTLLPARSPLGVSIGVPRDPLSASPPRSATSNHPLNARDADVGKVRAER